MNKEKCCIPEKYYNYYLISIVDYGNGYHTEQNESLLFSTGVVFCFDDMPTEIRCIDIKPLFNVRWSENTELEYESY